VGFGHTGGDRADPDFRYQLDADAGAAIGVFQVVDQFGQILDGVDIVVRRRRNQADPRGGVTGLGDPGEYLGAGQFAPFTRLGPLGHFDLDLAGVGQVVAGDAETARCHLLDGAVLGVALLVGPGETLGVLAPFAGVGTAADAVHGDGQRLVGLLADGAVGHGAGLEALHDLFDRFNLVDGNRYDRLAELQQAAQGVELGILLVDQR